MQGLTVKHAEYEADRAWGLIAQSAEEGDDLTLFRYLYEGLIFPKKESLMLRCRMTAGVLSVKQIEGVANIAREFGGGGADITTRGNLQVRDIAYEDGIQVLRRLVDLEIAPAAPGVNNLRNVTVTPTTGFDAHELIDVMPIAQALTNALIFHESLQGLPGKFNIAVDSAGSVGVCGEANDMGFYAVDTPDGVKFRMTVAGWYGEDGLAGDAGVLLDPEQVVPVAAAAIKVFLREGDFSKRLRSRLKFLVASVGGEQFLEWLEELVDFDIRVGEHDEPEEKDAPKDAPKDGQFGMQRQKGVAKQYAGVVVPGGRLTADQLSRVSAIAEQHGSGQVRFTVWQNCIIPDLNDIDVPVVQRKLKGAGLTTERYSFAAGMVACTGSAGCKFSATDTKLHAREVAHYLDASLASDQKINLHFTGCSFSCAQPYVGDIGLYGARWKEDGEWVEGYHVHLGAMNAVANDGQKSTLLSEKVPYAGLAAKLVKLIGYYQKNRMMEESFAEFTRRAEVDALRAVIEGGCRV